MTSSLVRDVMTTKVVTAEPSTPFKEIAARLTQHRISAVPVVDADRRVLGIVTEADLLLKQEHPDPKATVPLVWTRRRRLERAKAAAPVADERGQLLGIVSRADLLKVFTRPDEAIRSEIINDVIAGDLMLNPNRFVIRVDDGVVVLEGEADRSSLIPYLVRVVHHVEGVVRVENKLSFDVDDYDPAMAYPWMRP